MIRGFYPVRWIDMGGGARFPIGYRVWLLRFERALDPIWDSALKGVQSGTHALDSVSAIYEPRLYSLFYNHSWKIGEWNVASCNICGGQLKENLWCPKHPYRMGGFHACNDLEVVAHYLGCQLGRIYIQHISRAQNPAPEAFWVVGVCLGGGRIVVHERGWRAERAYVARLIGPDIDSIYVWGLNPERPMEVRAIHWRYGEDIPVLANSRLPEMVEKSTQLYFASQEMWSGVIHSRKGG